MRCTAIRLVNVWHCVITGFLPVITVLAFCVPAAAQPITDTTHVNIDSTAPAPAPVVRRVDNETIVSFEGFDMPNEMIARLRDLQPKGVLLFHDEFQFTRDGDYGQEIAVIKIWYIDDHFVGYMIETPMDGAGVHKHKIDIPAAWCCTPVIKGHDEHCVSTLAQMRTNETDQKCSGWHIKLPDADIPQQQQLIEPRPKKGKKGKKPGFQTGN